jgi:DNA-binding XRE family transcriptional regulator
MPIKRDLELNKLVGQNVKHLRKKSKHSQEGLAKLLKISRPTMNHYEVGKTTIPYKTLLMISKLYEKPYEWFFNEN